MKTINNFILLLLLMVSTSSCLKAGLDDLETYDQSEITNIRFEYRWWDETEKRLRVIEMNVDKNIDAKSKEISCTITVPEASNAFTSSVRENVSLNNLTMNVDISTAARIKPIGNSPTLGAPQDFSAKDFIYQVTSASGTSTEWSIKIIDFKK